jgi:cytochrome P450
MSKSPAAAATPVTTPSSQCVRLPPGPRLPGIIQAIPLILFRRRTIQILQRRYGPSFSVRSLAYGPTVVISEPALAKQLFQARDDVKGVEPSLEVVFGRGSTFGLHGQEHLQRRKLLVPPFHGKRMRSYESILEDEAQREMANWLEGQEFPVQESMMRITLNAILRAVFGAEGAEFEALRTLLPAMVESGARMTVAPFLRVDLGPWSPWGRFLAKRREFDALITALIEKAESDPNMNDRQDVLSLMLEARYEDGEAMSHNDIADELLTLLVAGHETTATTLAWAVERLRRHPAVLSRLVREVDSGGSELRQATIQEVQRTRPVIETTGRQVVAPTFNLGEWVLPRGHTVLASIGLTHQDETAFPRPSTFDPDRFLGTNPDQYAWVPFGGGTRRCLGAAFANMEMNVVLRTLLTDFELTTTDAPDERSHSRGIINAPANGGRAEIHRRASRADTSPSAS